MRGGQTLLNSGDLTEQRKAFLKKLFKNRPLCEMSLGNKMVLDSFLDHFSNIFFDASFIAVKSYDTEWATQVMKIYTNPKTGYFVDFQNGINDHRMASIVGKDKSLGSVITIGAACYEPGKVIRTDNYHLGFKVAEQDGSISDRLKDLKISLVMLLRQKSHLIYGEKDGQN